MNPALVFAWLAEIGLITWRDFKGGRTVASLPPPSDYLATFVVFGGLAAVSTAGPEAGNFAALFGWSLVLASFINAVDPTNPLGGKVTPIGGGGSAGSGNPLTTGPSPLTGKAAAAQNAYNQAGPRSANAAAGPNA